MRLKLPRIKQWFLTEKMKPIYQKLMPSHKNYQKFIIVGRSRSGSNLLRGLLNNHDQIMAFGELFQNMRFFDWAMAGYEQTEQDLALIRSDPTEFLNTRVFGRYPLSVQAVGFKIFYYHAQEGSWTPVWPYLHAMADLKIIHIKRKNILRTHLSRMRAVLTNQWVNTTGDNTQEQAITLKYEDCLEDFTQTRAWELDFEKRFTHHDIMEVYYEDLAEDYSPIVQRLQSFLRVDPQPTKPQTYKQAQLPLSQAIGNYHELRASFQGTPWEEFFEETS